MKIIAIIVICVLCIIAVFSFFKSTEFIGESEESNPNALGVTFIALFLLCLVLILAGIYLF